MPDGDDPRDWMVWRVVAMGYLEAINLLCRDFGDDPKFREAVAGRTAEVVRDTKEIVPSDEISLDDEAYTLGYAVEQLEESFDTLLLKLRFGRN